MPITKHQWANGVCFTTDSEELAAWWAAHPSSLPEFGYSTKRDNYGLTGKKSPPKKNQFEIGRKVHGESA